MFSRKSIVLFFLMFSVYVYSVNDSTKVHWGWYNKHLFVSAGYINGNVAPTNVFVRGSNLQSARIDHFQAINLKFGTQTTGDRYSEQLFNSPVYGVGLKLLDFHNPAEIGFPIAVYGFTEIPFIRYKKFMLNAEAGFGISFNWQSFNPITNQYNISLGLGQAFMSDAGLNATLQISPKVDLFAGFNFTHFSNGSIKQPNFGINSYAPKVGIKYNFNDRPDYFPVQKVPYKPHGEWVFSTFAAMKNVIFDSVKLEIREKYEGAFFPVFGVSALYNWRVSPYSSFGIGGTFDFNESINAQVAVENNELEDIDGPFFEKLELTHLAAFHYQTVKVR